ncbi:MAG TPA: response regulator [Pyrinomonadaceae bacterium]
MPNRVLIVDDEENIREMIRLALEAAGYEVGEAGSGLEAFAVIGGDESWDAVLLDQKMPGMVGTEILRRLKVMLPTARVIMRHWKRPHERKLVNEQAHFDYRRRRKHSARNAPNPTGGGVRSCRGGRR